jgi:hypothetical protein
MIQDPGDPVRALDARVRALASALRSAETEADFRFDVLKRSAAQQVEGLEERASDFINQLIYRVGVLERQVLKLKKQVRDLEPKEPEVSEKAPIYISEFLGRWVAWFRRIRLSP